MSELLINCDIDQADYKQITQPHHAGLFRDRAAPPTHPAGFRIPYYQQHRVVVGSPQLYLDAAAGAVAAARCQRPAPPVVSAQHPPYPNAGLLELYYYTKPPIDACMDGRFHRHHKEFHI